jgi:hypothetical protein
MTDIKDFKNKTMNLTKKVEKSVFLEEKATEA